MQSATANAIAAVALAAVAIACVFSGQPFIALICVVVIGFTLS